MPDSVLLLHQSSSINQQSSCTSGSTLPIKMERIRVACLGDGITKGTFSYNWIGQLATAHELKDYKFINFGRNGDLAYNALRRTDEVIATNPDRIIILIGTNDILAVLTPANTRRYMISQRLREKPTLERYAENLEKIIVKLKQHTNASIALCTLPVLGEDSSDEANTLAKQYNAVIKRLSNEHDTDLLDLSRTMTERLLENPPALPVSVQKHPVTFTKAAIRRLIFREDWNSLSERHGLTLTTDTIHLNETGGRMFAQLALHFIAGPAGSFFWPRPSAEMYERYRMQFSF